MIIKLVLLVPVSYLMLFLLTFPIFGLYRIFGGKKSYCQFWGGKKL